MRLRGNPPLASDSKAAPSSRMARIHRPSPKGTPATDSKRWWYGICAVALIIVFFLFFGPTFGAVDVGVRGASGSARYTSTGALRVATWNIAAINNNPFEYWITHEDKAYNKLMADVQKFVDNPGDKDIPVSDVFTQGMFDQLKAALLNEPGASQDFVSQVEQMWENDYKSRKIVSGFLKDPTIGSKRLASMPDRVTNTIGLASGSMIYRPTVINCFQGYLGSTVDWWEQWKEFMFETKNIFKAGEDSRTVSSLLVKIKKSKYPAITTQEETISIPLQTLAAAIFDSILVHMMNIVGPDTWQPLRKEICAALNLKKMARTQEILERAYADVDVVFLQEVSAKFIRDVRSSILQDRYHILAPAKLNRRDQNSVVMLRREIFYGADVEDATADVYKKFDKSVPVADGDVYAFYVTDMNNRKFFFASFLGDTNGLATIPVLKAVNDVFQASAKGQNGIRFIFGLDANTYEHAVKGKTQDVLEFETFYKSLGMSSCWGKVNPQNHTTYNARTYLQTQLNKASAQNEILTKGDVNPKDFILFFDNALKSTGTAKDNTGKHKFIEGMVFPTLTFPSDHGILSTTLTLAQ